jgi:hypothetical protein
MQCLSHACIKNLDTTLLVRLYQKPRYNLNVSKISIQIRCIQNLDTIYQCIKNLDTIWIALITSEHMFITVYMFTGGGGGQLCVCR